MLLFLYALNTDGQLAGIVYCFVHYVFLVCTLSEVVTEFSSLIKMAAYIIMLTYNCDLGRKVTWSR